MNCKILFFVLTVLSVAAYEPMRECGPNTVWNRCRMNCQLHCGGGRGECREFVCVSGCACDNKKGYTEFRGKCISALECYNLQKYKPWLFG